MDKKNISVIVDENLSKPYKKRFVIIDSDTGEVLDDAQGYGYKTAQKAHAAWAYKTRDKSKDGEKAKRKKEIRAWINEHKSFVGDLEQFAFEIMKGSWGPDDKFDAKFVKKMLDERGYKVNFTASQLIKEMWQ